MDAEHAKKMMDAFFEAKRIRDQLPPLPAGVHASYIHTLDAVSQLSERQEQVRVSDVAEFQRLPRPGVTRTVKEMEAAGLIRKSADEKDGRVVHLEMTDKGRALYETYVQEYFGALTKKLDEISNEEADEMIRVIHKAGEALR